MDCKDEKCKDFFKPQEKKKNGSGRAFLVGSGPAALTAAFFLLRDGKFSGDRIVILGAPPAGSGPEGRRKDWPQESDVCFRELLRSLPLPEDPDQTALDVFSDRYHRADNEPRPIALWSRRGEERKLLTSLALSDHAAVETVKLFWKREKELKGKAIQELLPKEFFTSDFWLFCRLRFSLGQEDSAIEFQRCLIRLAQSIAETDGPLLMRGMPEQWEPALFSLLRGYLEKQNVIFKEDTVVQNVTFHIEEERRRAVQIDCCTGGDKSSLPLGQEDLLFITLSLGEEESGRSLWEKISAQSKGFGHPEIFFRGDSHTAWTEAEITLTEDVLPGKADRFSAVRDSAWLLHWISKEGKVRLFVGDRECTGDFVPKAAKECTGEEVCREWLWHLGIPEEKIPELAVQAQVLLREESGESLVSLPHRIADRPKVVPKYAENFAFIGTFAELPGHAAHTMEYQVRTGIEAVSRLLGQQRRIPKFFAAQYDLRVLTKAAACFLDGRKLTDLSLSLPQKIAVKKALKAVEGTVLFDLLKEEKMI